MMLRLFTAFAFAAVVTGFASAQEKNDAKPLLRLEAGGPTSNVTSLAFSPDGKTLYVAGFDKVVRVWRWNVGLAKFELDEAISFRVPIGPGADGAINALALSEDGQWLAVGGFGVVGDAMKFNEAGRLIPTKGGLTPTMRFERGQITVFNTRDRSVKTLKGHSGPVLSMTFAKNSNDNPRLLSAAEGWDFKTAKVNGEAKVWDVAGEKEIEGQEMAPLTFARRPGLAMYVRADGKLKAFMAWEDGRMSHWDVGLKSGSAPMQAKWNIGLDLAPGNAKLLMTGIAGVKGVVEAYSADFQDWTSKSTLEMPSAGKDEYDLPLAVRYCGVNSDAAVIVRHLKGGVIESDALWIVPDLGAAWGNVAAKIFLGGRNNIVPALAASNNHIAVGGFPDHRVLVFAIKDALAGKAEPMVLRSAGATMRSVAFAKKGVDRGLSLSEKTGAGKGEFVLDLANGKLRPTAAEWLDDSAPAGEYRVMLDGLKATLVKANQAVATATLKEGTITATAISPPLLLNIPLVAIASYIPEKGATLLELMDGATGQTLRRFVGHTAPIRSLSFRADGKLLASAADDQTTIVWSLTDLRDVVGKHGSLGDLAIDLRDKDLVVVDAAGIANLNKDDFVRGLYDKTGKLNSPATPAAFYERLWLKKPNQNVKLKITRAGLDVDIEVGVRQGVDVRKPLFSLFFPRDEAGKLGDWLGWNAIGPYDSSRREAEQYLGWHFNTGKAERPTAFAFIDQYRKEYYRPGLLKEMAELGDLPPPPKPPAPKPALLVPGVAVEESPLSLVGGEYLLRKKAFELQVTIPAYEPLDKDELTYQVDSGPELLLEPANVNSWSAKIELPPGAEASHRVAIRMKRTPEGWPTQLFRTDVSLRLMSPPPTIAFDAPKVAEPIKVDKAEYAVKAGFAPGEAGVAYRATLAQESLGKKIASRELKSDKASDLAATLTLEPGLNVIQLRAVNEWAIGRSHEGEEASATSIKILYEPRRVPPPTLTLIGLTSNEAIGIAHPVLKADPTPFRLQSRNNKAFVTYSIKSEEKIASLAYELGAAKERRNIQLPPKDSKGAFEVQLTPGTQTLRVFLKTETGVEVAVEQEIEFRPPALTQPIIANFEEGFKMEGDRDAFETPLDIRFTPVKVNYLLPVVVEALVTAGDKTIGKSQVVVDASTGSAKFEKIALAHGSNTVQVRLRHEFGGDDSVTEVHGRYVRPPKIATLTTAPIGKTPFVDVKAGVISVIPPSPEFVGVTVNGRPVPSGSIDVQKGEAAYSWIIEAKQIPLAAIKGKDATSDIRLSLATSDGEAHETLKEPVVFSLPLAPAPEITLLEPALREATLSDPTMKLRFKVSTEAPPTRVEVVRGDKILKQWQAIPVSADGVYEFSLPEVALDWGVTSLGILAWNEGGVRTVGLNVNVPPQPVRLELDRIEIAPAGIRIEPGIDGRFPPAPAGRVVLHGSVRWNSNDDALLQKAAQVHLYVNGMRHLPVNLKPVVGKSRERKFEAPVVLNYQDNNVEIDLPELKQDAANRRKISLGCLAPISGQHLHVLIIAPQEKDEAKLVDNLSRAIKATKIKGDQFETKLFKVVRFYVLAGRVETREITTRLNYVAADLKKRAQAGNPNDLVMIYFQGKETVDENGPALWTSEQSFGLQLTLKDLSKNYLSRFSGGQVLILDTMSQAGDIDFRDARFAFLRRPDPRPFADAGRPSFASELEKEMPRVIWLDQLTTVLAAQVRPSFQSFLPEPLRNKIQLNPN